MVKHKKNFDSPRLLECLIIWNGESTTLLELHRSTTVATQTQHNNCVVNQRRTTVGAPTNRTWRTRRASARPRRTPRTRRRRQRRRRPRARRGAAPLPRPPRRPGRGTCRRGPCSGPHPRAGNERSSKGTAQAQARRAAAGAASPSLGCTGAAALVGVTPAPRRTLL